MDVILDLLPKSVAATLRAQPGLLMLLVGIILTVIVIVVYDSRRRW